MPALLKGCEGSGSRPVSRVLSKAVIHLRRTSPHACSDLPGSGAGHASSPIGDALLYLVLLRVGFTLPPVSPPARCALTAPFHPYLATYCASRSRANTRRSVFCGTFRGLTPPRRYLAPCPSEPGLSSAPCGGGDCPVDSRRTQCDTRASCFKHTSRHTTLAEPPPAPAPGDTARSATHRSTAPRPPPSAAP